MKYKRITEIYERTKVLPDPVDMSQKTCSVYKCQTCNEVCACANDCLEVTPETKVFQCIVNVFNDKPRSDISLSCLNCKNELGFIMNPGTNQERFHLYSMKIELYPGKDENPDTAREDKLEEMELMDTKEAIVEWKDFMNKQDQ